MRLNLARIGLLLLLITAAAAASICLVIALSGVVPGITKFRVPVVALLTAALTALTLLIYTRDVRTHTRLQANLCPACGYDLRASLARCPECGAINPHTVVRLPLRDDWPPLHIAPRKPDQDESLILIHEAQTPWEATTLAKQLRVRGIPSDTKATASAKSTHQRGTPRIHALYVWSADESTARALVERLLIPTTIQRPAPQSPPGPAPAAS